MFILIIKSGRELDDNDNNYGTLYFSQDYKAAGSGLAFIPRIVATQKDQGDNDQ